MIKLFEGLSTKKASAIKKFLNQFIEDFPGEEYFAVVNKKLYATNGLKAIIMDLSNLEIEDGRYQVVVIESPTYSSKKDVWLSKIDDDITNTMWEEIKQLEEKVKKMEPVITFEKLKDFEIVYLINWYHFKYGNGDSYYSFTAEAILRALGKVEENITGQLYIKTNHLFMLETNLTAMGRKYTQYKIEIFESLSKVSDEVKRYCKEIEKAKNEKLKAVIA